MIGLVLAAAVATQPPAILGQRVGYPVELPQCPEPFDFFDVKNDCWLMPRREEDVGVNKGVRMLELSAATLQKASFVKAATITVEGDRVIAMYLHTTGIDDQEDILTALARKFGKPSTAYVERLQNRMGAKFAGVRATWRRVGLIVTFDSTAEGLDDGAIDIMTPGYAQRRARAAVEPSL
jgi:hypothetical protein